MLKIVAGWSLAKIWPPKDQQKILKDLIGVFHPLHAGYTNKINLEDMDKEWFHGSDDRVESTQVDGTVGVEASVTNINSKNEW